MGSLKVVTISLLLGSLLGSPAFAQSPTYGVGRTPTAEELRRMDISIGPTGEELPPGRGSAKEGAQVYVQKGCVGCHGAAGIGGLAPILQSKQGAGVLVDGLSAVHQQGDSGRSGTRQTESAEGQDADRR